MATTKEFHDYVVGNLQRVGDVTTRKMMGEYCVYFQGKLIGDICDRDYPYEGSKTQMVIVEDVENEALMAEILQEMYKELPEPKKKAKRV